MHVPQGGLVAPTATVSSSDDSEDEADSEGERKIDTLGQLLGGREFICPVVTSPFRSNPRRQYILTMDCCRFTGARDSYMLFKQHPRMRRVETTQRERDMLADRRLIPKVTRFRPIAMITARTAFREFGARIVKNGRYVTDDYW
ncbi:chromatin-remodelling complex, RSC SWI/SNF subunit Rsc7/Swp82, partial [Kickxella alabastrina]|uniref:chromatin-remodelling complex, RSC SWI/SNF subunit Rsc7/Swp82 n=1 Tax=Kickxella alabastrina TaxID=61397 RepID=UPI00221ED230